MVKVASIKNIISDLKPRQQKTMRTHARHHTLKHMRSMARDIKKGRTFRQAHISAMRKVGK
jgi:sialic acid synthase SpsE